MSLNNPYPQIIFNHRGEHNKRLHALARIHGQLVFAIGLQCDWGKCIVIPHIIVHTNDIIAEKENISTIRNLRTLANIHQDQNYQGEGWFHIPFIKSCRSKWTFSIECTSIGKISLAEKLRIKNKLCTAREIVREYIKDFKVHGGLSTRPVGALPFKAGEQKNLHICVWNLNFSRLFSIIITLDKIKSHFLPL